MAIIDYYMTLNSPWSYLGVERLIAIAARHKAHVAIKPAKFGEVFARTGGLPVAKRSPERQAYRLAELRRWRDHLGIAIVIQPKHFPADETLGTRLVIAAALAGLDAVALSREIGRAIWEREENIAEASVLDAAAARAGIDAAALRRAAPGEAELDAILAANTAEALARGVFGAPSYRLATGEFFWGQDRLEFLDRALGRS